MYRMRGMGIVPVDPILVSGPVTIDTSSNGPDTFSASDLASLVPAVGPDASQVAPLQVGALAQQVSSSGQYSINPSTGQLQQNVVAGVSNASLLWIVGGGLAAVMALGVFAGGRRR